MKLRFLCGALVATAIVAAPAPAHAKGIKDLTISGPGLTTPMEIDNEVREFPPPPGAVRRANAIYGESGLMAALTHEQSRPISATPPPGRLGPRYEVIYNLDPSWPSVRQIVYPFAAGGPVTFTPPGQYLETGRRSVCPSCQTRVALGGWYRAHPTLRFLLVSAGIPEPPPLESPRSVSTGGGLQLGLMALGAGLVAVLVGTGLRRRHHALATS